MMTIVLPISAQVIEWVEPFMPSHEGLPPANTEIYLYHTGQSKYLTRGTKWGTHAALTDNIEGALVYQLDNQGTHYEFYSPDGGGSGLLFVSNVEGDVYSDWVSTTNPKNYTYFSLVALSDGTFRIAVADNNGWTQLTGYCLAWNPSNVDVDNGQNSLGTNIGIFALPVSDDVQASWTYQTQEDVEIYRIRQQIFKLYLEHAHESFIVDNIKAVYNDPNSTLSQLTDAYAALQTLIIESGGRLDMTSYITNPTFEKDTNGWFVDMPHAQNKGFQSALYTNGDVSVNRFAEAWIPSGGTLREGAIYQQISGLPEGRYMLEADMIACNQLTGEIVSGVELMAENTAIYTQEVTTGNGQPMHVSLDFICEGGNVTIGVRTLGTTTANWFAIDNVSLSYQGKSNSDAIHVDIQPSTHTLALGETIALIATVAADDAIYQHVVWTSSNTSVAIVNADGIITAQSAGNAVITARAVASTIAGESSITVSINHPEHLVINEIQTANIDMFLDPSVNYGGWIELYNPTAESISTSGLILCDTIGNRFQLSQDMGAVPAHGYKTIWFDHYDTGKEYSDQAYQQVNFKLEYEGGVINICDKDNNLLLTQEYPQAIQRCSYARTTDGGDTWAWTSQPTPASSNNNSPFATTQLPMPVVDRDATVFTTGFSVNVVIPEGATLRYTTDGSTPTLENGETSETGNFEVPSGTTSIYRFRLYQDGYLPSSIVTRTYVYRDKEYYLPIISVVTANANLYDDTIGAYVDGTNGTSGNNKSFSNKNRGWERPVNFEYLVPNEQLPGAYTMAVNQECDFEVCGGWSRHFTPGSSFRLKGGKYYLGQNFFPYPIFDNKPYIKNKTLQIRNGGNDNHGRIKDAAIHEVILQSGFNIDCQATQPTHVFINGQYMFMFNVREPNNKNHGYSNYGIDTDEMDQFEINGSKGYEQKSGDDVVFRQWMTLAQQLADNPTDESIFEQICQIVDIDEYTNYMAAECYSGCNDWLTNSNNAKGYRSRNDGKFHLIFMDQDQGFTSTSMLSNLANHLYDSRYDTGKNFLIDIFLNMLHYEPFRKRFIDAFCLVNGSVFVPDRINAIVSEMKNRAYRAMEFDGEASSLESSANDIIHAMSTQRATRITNMANYFGLNKPYNVRFRSNINSGAIMLNGQEVPTGRFDGTLYEPATLSAKAPTGYQFKCWQLDGSSTIVSTETLFDTSASWSYYDKGSLDGTNWWQEGYNASGWATAAAPFGYGNVGINGSSDYVTNLDYGSDSNYKRPTYYFRKEFRLSDAPAENEVLQLTYYVDDGFIAYVNGIEIGRYLMKAGNAVYADYSTAYVSSTAGTGTITIPRELLKIGDNVLAVEVHNTSATSSDIYWTAKLEKGAYQENEFLTEETLDITTLENTTASLIAVYEPLPDEKLLHSLATPIKVNEVSAGNSVFINDYFKKNDWLELYNTTDTDLDIAGLYLSDDIADPLKYQIPVGTIINTIIPAHGHLVVWADKLSPVTQLHTNFKLSNSDGQIALVTSSADFFNANVDYFRAHTALRDFADGLPYNAHRGDQSVGRYPDGASQLYQMSRPTIEKANSLLTLDNSTGVDTGIMNITDTSFKLDMQKGWNWISHPLNTPVTVDVLKDYADLVQSQTQEAYYNSKKGTMDGQLKRMSTGKMYKVLMTNDHLFELEGQIASAASPTPLQPGWNWIGYPLEGTQTVTAALATSKVDEGDIIVGQSGFSVYSNEEGWVGSLSSLTSGKGYMYKTSNAKALHFQPATAKVSLRCKMPRRTTACDRYAWPCVMGIIGQVKANGETLSPQRFTVYAYADGECRSKCETVGGQLFLTVYGAGSEELSFKAVDNEGHQYDVAESIVFNADIVGTRKQPFVFTLSASTTALPQELADDATEDVHPIGIYNLSGLFVSKNTTSLSPGIYIVRYSNGLRRKIMIKK